MLQSPDVPVEAKLFAVTTLKGKVSCYRVLAGSFPILTAVDYFRPRSVTGGICTPSEGFRSQFAHGIRFRSPTYSNTVMCVPRESCDSDDAMERCFAYGGHYVGKYRW